MRVVTAAACLLSISACAAEAGYVRTGPSTFSLLTTQKTADDAAAAIRNRATDLCSGPYQMSPVQLSSGEKISASAELTCLPAGQVPMSEAPVPAPAAAPVASSPPAPPSPPAPMEESSATVTH
jgi:hypothetical protein